MSSAVTRSQKREEMGENTGTSTWIGLYLGVGFIASATILLQLLQTRILSALYQNHVVYLTVTIALLGFGISGVAISILFKRIQSPMALATGAAAAFGLLVPTCLHAASYTTHVLPLYAPILKLVVCYFLLTIPFVCAGLVLGTIFMCQGKNIYRLYFFDLASSALGAVFFVWLLQPLGAEGLSWVVALLGIASFFFLGLVSKISWREAGGMLALLLCLFFWLRGDLINDYPEPYKTGGYFDLQRHEDFKIEATEWHPIAKIDVVSTKDYGQAKRIVQDREALTAMMLPPEVERTLASVAKNEETGESIGWQAITYGMRPQPDKVLVIGVGGGKDVVLAKAFGAKEIVGVEINSATIELVTQHYADQAVWPHWDNVEVVCLDGRTFVANADEEFDVMVMSGIDTFSALSTGAYVLSENYLYTVESMGDYLSAVKEGGVIGIFRWLFSKPRESLRLANLYLEWAEQNEMEAPEKQLMVIGVDIGWNYNWAATYIKKGQAYTADEIKMALEIVEKNDNLYLVYLPPVLPAEEEKLAKEKFFSHGVDYFGEAREIYAGLINASQEGKRPAFAESYTYNITPVYDDRPFFFEYHKINELFSGSEANFFRVRGIMVHYTLYIMFFVTLLVCLFGMLLPLYFYQKDGLQVPGASQLVVFFSSLGVGFMFIEIGMIQRLSVYLGSPIYSLTVVLAGVLVFTGLGSYFASLFTWLGPRKLLAYGMLGTAALAVAWNLLIDPLIHMTMGYPLEARVALVLLSILPLGVAMGFPFATGLRYLDEQSPRFIPWAWGINGMTSVLGSILAILLAMRIGFSVVVLIAALIYLLAYLISRSRFATQFQNP